MDELLTKDLTDQIIDYGIKFALALLVLIIGFAVIGRITSALTKVMSKRGVDATLQPFLRDMLGAILKILLVVSVLGMVGVEVTSFIAILGAAGLAIGMALSGTLQNFAGGVLILIFKPFKVGHVIDAQGFLGTVHEIQLFNTVLKTFDNKTIIIPNGGLSTGSLTNLSLEQTRRVDMSFGIGYGDDVDKGREVLNRLIAEDKRILQEPAPFVAVSELADSSVNFVVRVWANASDYWGIYFDMQEKVYKTFDKEGLNIPYPQMDVHVHEQTAS
ncbi:MAG: mechanosensitive ion channel domain-containing protein [Bacteroidota bacterium]